MPQKGKSLQDPLCLSWVACMEGLGPDSSAFLSLSHLVPSLVQNAPPAMTLIVAALSPLGEERLSFQRGPHFTTWSKPDTPFAPMAGSGAAPCWSA